MGVSPGSPVSAANTNPAFLDANADDTAVGKISLANTLTESGDEVVNTQAAINAAIIATGALETDFAVGVTYTGAPASTVIDGQNHLQSIVRLAQKFDPSTGHSHSGSPGDGPAIDANALNNFNHWFVEYQKVDILNASGINVDVSSYFSGKIPGGNPTGVGVITDLPYNRVELGGKFVKDLFFDTQGSRIFGRLTAASGMSGYEWTLTFRSLSTFDGSEGDYIFPLADITLYYQEVFTQLTRPTIYDNPSVLTGGAGGGGGGSLAFKWYEVGPNAAYFSPPGEDQNLPTWRLEAGEDNTITGYLKVPESANTGVQLFLKVPYICNDNPPTTVLIKADTSVFHDGSDSADGPYSSTNVALETDGVSRYQYALIDITDSDGLIGGSVVSPGDILYCVLSRGTDTSTVPASVAADLAEITT